METKRGKKIMYDVSKWMVILNIPKNRSYFNHHFWFKISLEMQMELPPLIGAQYQHSAASSFFVICQENPSLIYRKVSPLSCVIYHTVNIVIFQKNVTF